MTLLAVATPMIASATKLHYTVVKPVRQGDQIVAWSEIRHPSGRSWTLGEIRANGYKVISRAPAQMTKGKVN